MTQIQVFRTIASTTSAAQIPIPQHRYPFLEIRSLSQSITFACSSPQDSGSAFVPMSLFMSFSLIPITVTADQIGTVQSRLSTNYLFREFFINFSKRINRWLSFTRRGSVLANYGRLHRARRNSKLLRDEVLKPTAVQKRAQPDHAMRREA